MTITEQIKQELASGKRVFSKALGRVGEITDVVDSFNVRVKLNRGTGITTFERGDVVEVTRDVDGVMVIRHPDSEWKNV